MFSPGYVLHPYALSCIMLSMRMIYKVVTNKDFKIFQQDVQKHLDEGWFLQGNLVATVAGNDEWFYQAIHRYA